VRRHPDETSENGREVRLRLKADTQCDVNKALLRILKERLGARDALPQQVFVRAYSHSGAKLCGEMHSGQPSCSCKIRELDRIFDVVGDVSNDPREPPLREWGDPSPSYMRPADGLAAANLGQDCNAEEVRIETGELGRNSVGAR
jgi:hypothetical protein